MAILSLSCPRWLVVKTLSDMIVIHQELNIKGEICPYTFVKSKLALEDMEVGQMLRVIVDYLPAVVNVPRSMRNEGHEVLEVVQLNDTDWSLVIKKQDC